MPFSEFSAKDSIAETGKHVKSSDVNLNPDDFVERERTRIEPAANEVNKDDPDEFIERERPYFDDNGFLYRKGDNLVANNSYEINGYHYETDSLGRIASAGGKLRLTTREQSLYRKDSMDSIGRGSQRDTDERGHPIGDRFDGSSGLENLVPMDRTLNRGPYKSIENRLAKALENGSDVRLKVEPKYTDDTRRPSSFVIIDSVDGELTLTVLKNESRQ